MMKKRVLAMLLALLMVLGVMPARVVMAVETSLTDSETGLAFTISGSKATIIGYAGKDKDTVEKIVVPTTVSTEGAEKFAVVAIGANAFSTKDLPKLNSIAVLGKDVVIDDNMCNFLANDESKLLWGEAGSTLEAYAKSHLLKINNIATDMSEITDTRGTKTYVYTETSGFAVTTELTVGTIYGEEEEMLDIADITWTSQYPDAVSVVPKSYVYDKATGKVKATATVTVKSLEGLESIAASKDRKCDITATTMSGIEKKLTISNIKKSAKEIKCECKIYSEEVVINPETKKIEGYKYTLVDEDELTKDKEGNFTYYKDGTVTVDKDYIVSFRPYVEGSKVGEGEEEDSVANYLVQVPAPYERVMEFAGYDSSGNLITPTEELYLSEDKDDYVFRMNTVTDTGKSSITFNTASSVLSKKINIDIKCPTESVEVMLDGTNISTGTSVIAGFKGQLTYKLNGKNRVSTDTATWSVNDTNKASVSSAGVLEANQDGVVYIKCKVDDSAGIKRSAYKEILLQIIKKIEYKKIGLATSVDGEAVPSVDVENGKTLTVYPVEAAKRDDDNIPNEYVSYTSSNTSVASVDDKGIITGKSVGSATITVSANGRDMTSSITVNVFAPITEIKLAEEAGSIPVGQTKIIKYSLNTGATDKVIWQSLDKSIATVVDNGNGEIAITAVKVGQTNVEGYAKNNEAVKKNTQVTVVPAIHMETLGIKVADTSSYDDIYISEEEDTKGITVYEVERGKSIVFEPNFAPDNSNDGLSWSHEVTSTKYATGSVIGTQLTVKAETVGGIQVFTLTSTNGKTAVVGVKPVVKATAIDIKSGAGVIASAKIELGKTMALSTNVLPTDTTDYIEWSVTKDDASEDVVTLDKVKTEKGEVISVTGVKAGKAVLTATTKSGKIATVEINVVIPTTEMIFKDGDKVIDATAGLVVYSGVNKTVTIDVLPAITTDKSFTWSSNNSAVTVTPLEGGKSATITSSQSTNATVTVTTETGKTFNLLVKSLIPAGEINFTCTKTAINLNGPSVVATCEVGPTTSNDVITYTVDKEGIVTLTPNAYNPKSVEIKGIGQGSVIITATTGSGKASSITLDVVTVDMSSTDIVVTGISEGQQLTYTGSEIKPVNLEIRCLSNSNVKLVEGTDYEVKYENNTNVTNEAKLTITGLGNYSGERVITYKIVPKSGNNADLTVSFEESKSSAQLIKVYDGNVVKPTIVVEDSKRAESEVTLINGVDYDIEYSNANAVNQGTYGVTVKFKGNYTGTRALSYAIQRKSIADLEDGTKNVSVLGIEASYAYTGTAIIPEFSVKDLARNVNLAMGADKDYTVSYSYNLNATTADTKAKITITGCGNYQGVVTCEFEITPADLSKVTVDPINSVIYTGNAITPFVIVKNGTVSVSSGNYDIAYSNNIKAGKATITLTGKANYAGTKTVTFKILPTQVVGLKQTAATNTSVKLSWTKNPSAQGVSGYYIYKVNTKTNKYTKVGSTTKNYFTVSGLKAGQNYVYAVAAQKSGYVGAYSSNFTAMTSSGKTTIKRLKATGNGTVTVSLKAVAGATSYKIYTSTNGKKYKLATTTPFADVTLSGLKAKKKIYVKVITIRNIGGKEYKSAYSAAKNIKVK